MHLWNSHAPRRCILASRACNVSALSTADWNVPPQLTFRHLKNHVASKLPVTYEDLKRDDLSEVIETATDEIANECDMGDVPISVCKMRIGYEEPKEEL